MFLHDIGQSPAAAFDKINKYLEENYGFRIAKHTSSQVLGEITSRIDEEVAELKLRGEDARTSPDIAKRLLILEGLRQLKEFVVTDFKSPEFDLVVKGLGTFVVDHFTVGGMCQTDVDKSMDRAMDEYRSSKYRFPDEVVCAAVREYAMSRLAPAGMAAPVFEGDDDTLVPGGDRARKALDALDDDPQDDPSEDNPNDQKGKIMKEHRMVVNLRRLLETEVSQAEVMMAAKGFAQELQEMIEKIGRLQNEDLPPVTDQMRQTYDTDSASSFQTQIYGAFQGVMDALYTAKNEVDDAVEMLASTGKVGNLTDMDTDSPRFGSDVSDELGDTDLGLGDLDNISEPQDDFGGADAENPLGRTKKDESVEHLKYKILEMKSLVNRVKRLKEA